jgi:hypothetical protein
MISRLINIVFLTIKTIPIALVAIGGIVYMCLIIFFLTLGYELDMEWCLMSGIGMIFGVVFSFTITKKKDGNRKNSN